MRCNHFVTQLLYRFANYGEAAYDRVLAQTRLQKYFSQTLYTLRYAGCIRVYRYKTRADFCSQWLNFLKDIRFQLFTQRATRDHINFAA